MKIFIISPTYPSDGHPVNTFIKQVVDEWADQGHECVVVAPFSVTKSRWLAPRKEKQVTGKGSIVTIYRPHYVSLSNLKIFGVNISTRLRNRAFNRVLKKLPPDADAMYGHFWNNAIGGFDYAKKYNIPLFVACGESRLSKEWGEVSKKPFTDFVKGVICVSTKNMDECVGLGMVPETKCIVAPNAFNPLKFYKMDKIECRKRLDFPMDAFIVCSTGKLCHRKGTERLSKAIENINDSNLYSIFIGGPGGENPTCDRILYKGEVQHEDLIYYLNASDVFVLPTLAEGCSNAIIEAIGCGLPIISSNLPFNWDVLDSSNSIMIDPNNIDEISKAITELMQNEQMRQSLADASAVKSRTLTITSRASKIISFMQAKIKEK